MRERDEDFGKRFGDPLPPQPAAPKPTSSLRTGQSQSLFEDPLRPAKPEKRTRGTKRSPEDELAFQLEQHQLPKFERKVHFAKAIGRRWEFDFACAKHMLAIEVEGLIVMRINGELVVKGRHASITGFREDCIKYASAAMLGWTVVRFEQSQVKDKTALEYVQRVLAARGWKRA